MLVRADILARDGASGWALAEVESSTQAKDYHLCDIAMQVWVMEQAGIALSGAAVRRIDNRFVLEREGNYAGLSPTATCSLPRARSPRSAPPW